MKMTFGIKLQRWQGIQLVENTKDLLTIQAQVGETEPKAQGNAEKIKA